jgi:hypothetical protein
VMALLVTITRRKPPISLVRKLSFMRMDSLISMIPSETQTPCA